MSNPILQAFFYGRAFAEVCKEKLEDSLTNVLSDIGKFEAEQREAIRQFTEEVQARAQREAGQARYATSSTKINIEDESPSDLQETIDNLRAEIASLKSELKQYHD